MRIVGQIVRLLIAMLVSVLLLSNSLYVLRSGLALFFAAHPEPYLRLLSFLAALMLELVFVLILKRIILRRPQASAP